MPIRRALGYFSDAETLIDFTYWCDQPVRPLLDHWQSVETDSAAQHLADLVDYFYTVGEPAEPALTSEVRTWLRQPAIGERLRDGGMRRRPRTLDGVQPVLTLRAR